MRPFIEEKRARAAEVNAFVAVIASTGRRFFAHGDTVARMEVDDRGRVWWVDEYNGARIYTHYRGRWRRFTHGGTMKVLVEAFRDYVCTGRKLGAGLFRSPSWACGGDVWGYGEDMELVREASAPLVRQPARAEAAS